MNEVTEAEGTPMPDTSPPEEQPEVPGEEPVPEEDFQSPEDAEADPESDNAEQAAYDGGDIPHA